ncbi:MAG: endolytic transglycosylase MltG [Candidatus Krumholzibacteria bacterium]|nr:endolytic transglycosylase MltG [Candidatus Krumholzibacteria bacterium]MDH5268655.1 endolytic transglycosylase MltG [Candidatus Krumholzibacteria bacterium]
MKHMQTVFKVLIALAIAGAVFIVFVVSDVTRRTARGGDPVRIIVAEGDGFGTVLAELQANGLVRRGWTFTFFARVLGHDRDIRRGTYEFIPGTPPVDVLRALVRGDVLSMRVTVPEGFNRWQIARAFGPAGVDSLAMAAEIRNPELLAALRVPVSTLEGYMFPDTYLVPFGSDAGDVVGQMLHRFAAEWTPDHDRRAAELGMTRHQVLTLASIVEAEARVPDERPRVSAVYLNRLARGMRLEADPTVAYAMGGFRGRLYYKDLKIDSPYNTYLHAGLPPGPICSPGAASIRSALYPDPEEHALYFVARGDGRHVFSATLKEHNVAVQEARRERARQADQK